MRVEYWDPEAGYKDFSHISHERLLTAAYVIKDATVRHLRSQIGKGKTTGINRPVYLTGDYAGQPWTAREFGQMLKSVRVVEKEESGVEVVKLADNVRVYAGHFLAFYANIFEYYEPFMRPAMEETLNEVKQILGVE
jgi:hypothetical protein